MKCRLVLTVLLCMLWIGLVGAGPSSEKAVLMIKLEWIKTSPKSTDSTIVVVDDGAMASVSRLSSDKSIVRSIRLQPTTGKNGFVTVKVDVREIAVEGKTPSKEFATEVTVKTGETKVIQSVLTKTEKEASEELLFITPNVQYN